MHGLEDLGAKLHRMSLDGKWNEMAAEVPDDVVRHFTAVGTYDAIGPEIEKLFGGASDTTSERSFSNPQNGGKSPGQIRPCGAIR